MSLDKYFKRYIWNDEKTPYFFSIDQLTKRQADYEVYAYTVFVGMLFAVIACAAVTGLLPQGKMMGVGLYAFSVVCACVVFSFTKFYPAGLLCASPPVAILLFFVLVGFSEKQNTINHIMVLTVVLFWAWYAIRVISIARAYPMLSDEAPGPLKDLVRIVEASFRWHRWLFIVAMSAMLVANVYRGGGWWTFWPMLGWSFVFGLHYCINAALTVDEEWVREREDDLRLRSYDLGHIEDIEDRLREKDNSIRPMVFLQYAAQRRRKAEAEAQAEAQAEAMDRTAAAAVEDGDDSSGKSDERPRD